MAVSPSIDPARLLEEQLAQASSASRWRGSVFIVIPQQTGGAWHTDSSGFIHVHAHRHERADRHVRGRVYRQERSPDWPAVATSKAPMP